MLQIVKSQECKCKHLQFIQGPGRERQGVRKGWPADVCGCRRTGGEGFLKLKEHIESLSSSQLSTTV